MSQPSEHQSKTNPLGEKSPRSDPNTSNDVFFPPSFRNYKKKENKIPDATHLYLKTAAVQHLHNFNLVPN